MTDVDFDVAVVATMSECIANLNKSCLKNDEHMKQITHTAASICLNTMLDTQKKPSIMHSIDGGKMQ
ncbi:hypothetical protein N9512_00475 [Amylibacter sp.]|jgi:hypothetical protein|nr:hypothetical protein [Amylibacter sp.]|tara:strand:- start:2450 stop:2650 length:201 start_codon:yes stop_codon:yes gene_type:complete